MKTFRRVVIVGLVAVLIGSLGLYWYAESRLAALELDVEAADRPADVRVLFIGNSHTHGNDLHRMVERLLEEAVPAWDDALVVRHAPGGRLLSQHAADMHTDGHPLNAALLTGSDTLRDWDYVILQEQSEVLGFWPLSDSFLTSLSAARQLATPAHEAGAQVLLYMLWGYRTGDDYFPNYYTDYPTMQTYTTRGYTLMARYLNEQGIPATVIPVGLGYRYIYNEFADAGAADAPRFKKLYAPDGYHPSVAGSYLVACMTVAAITGQPVADLTYRPDGLNADDAAYLRAVVDQVVFQDAFGPRTYAYQQQPVPDGG